MALELSLYSRQLRMEGGDGYCCIHAYLLRDVPKELKAMEKVRMEKDRFMTQGGGAYIPLWLIAVQIAFLAFVVLVSNSASLFIGAFLFFLVFAQATAHYQKKLDLRPPLLVCFFSGGFGRPRRAAGLVD